MKLIHKINGAHIAIVTFDSSARVSVPLTTDASAVMTAVKVLDLENSNYSTGTSIDKPIDVVKRLLEKVGSHTPTEVGYSFTLEMGSRRVAMYHAHLQN